MTDQRAAGLKPPERCCSDAGQEWPRLRIHSAAMSSGGAKTPAAIKPAYLIAGTDEGKIGAALSRLRARAEREGGPGALESFAPPAGGQAPDADALIAAIPSMSLMASRRYLLADGVERWTAKQAEAVIAELGRLPPDVTVVLVAREQPPKAKAPKGIAEAVEAAGGEVLRYQAPKARELPARLVAEASRHGFRLEPAAARLLVERLGDSTLRLGNELQRLALWAEPDEEVTAGDLEAMVADTSEEAAWALSDAIVARDPDTALRAAERLAAQGEAVTPLVYQAARRLREAHCAAPGAGGGELAEGGRGEARRCTPTRPRCWCDACGEPRRRSFEPPPARSPTWSGGPVAAPSTRTTWR